MRVLVTGASGRVGSQTAREFLDHGYEVRNFDQRPPAEDLRGRMETVYADLTDRLALLKAAEGCESIAHLAAIPAPIGTEDRIFPPNVVGTQYVLAAAEEHGIRRVALASTCCVFGIFFAKHSFDPQYFPMNEAHPALPQDLYGLSKQLNELTAAAYTRRCGMTTVSLRLTTVRNMAKPERWFRRALESQDRQNDMWTWVDVQDTARAFRLAIENAPEGTNETLIIAARDAFTAGDIRERIRAHFPALADQVADFEPHQSLYNTTLAEKHIGWVAERSWRDVPELSDLVGSR